MSSLAEGFSNDRTAGKREASATAEPVPVAECLDDAVVVFAPTISPEIGHIRKMHPCILEPKLCDYNTYSIFFSHV